MVTLDALRMMRAAFFASPLTGSPLTDRISSPGKSFPAKMESAFTYATAASILPS